MTFHVIFDYMGKRPKIKSSDANTYIWKPGDKYDIDFSSYRYTRLVIKQNFTLF